MEMEMEFLRKLPTPAELKEEYPVSAQVVATKAERDDEIRAIFEGKEDKLILVIGPCSADNEDAVIDYISRLRKVQDKVADKIFMIPRIYTNKPRTIGIGYKGMLHQPDPEKETDMLKGIIAIRQMRKRAVEETGFTCADEMLYPENHRYLSDLLSYVAVGARSVENHLKLKQLCFAVILPAEYLKHTVVFFAAKRQFAIRGTDRNKQPPFFDVYFLFHVLQPPTYIFPF